MSKIPKFVFFGQGDVAKAALLAMRKFNLIPSIEGEFGIVASYGKIIPKSVIDSFKYGLLNIHPSMLPLLRGPSPIKSAILENLEETGVSIMLLDEQLDHGPILIQEEIALSPRMATNDELRNALMDKGGELLVRVIPDWISGKLTPTPQDHSLATYTKKFKADEGLIPFSLLRCPTPKLPEYARDFVIAEHKVRALNPEPGTFSIIPTIRGNKHVKILKAHIEQDRFVPDIVQPAGKRPMSWSAFLHGHKIT